MKFINVPLFLISLAIGVFLIYVVNPRPAIIYVYPNPDNVGKIQYKDKSGMCFGFNTHKVSCPKERRMIREYPIQEGKRKVE